MILNHRSTTTREFEQERQYAHQLQISPKHIFIFVGGYFLLQLLSRVLISDSANLDEAEQLVLTQHIQWGYASQPPLYTWLQALFFTVFGTNIFALALLKNSLLFTTYAFNYLSAKQIAGEKTAGLLALLGLLYIPQIVWESQRDLTHSVLSTTIASATIFCAIKLFQTRKTLYYLLIGLCAATGVLSKYNYAVFLFAIIVSAGSLRALRPAVLDRRILLSTTLFILLVLPHFQWVLAHPEAAFLQSEKLFVFEFAGLLTRQMKGLTSLIAAAVGFFLPLSLVYLALCKGVTPQNIFSPRTAAEQFILRTMFIGLALCLLAVFGFNARFKDRWMQPLLFLVPIYFSLRLWQKFDATKIRKFCIVSGVLSAVVLFLLPLGTLSSSLQKKPTRLNAPYSALLEQLQPHVRSRLIVAENRLVGGNLRLKFQNCDVLVPELAGFPFSRDTPHLIVWDATGKTNIPPQLIQFVFKLSRVDLSKVNISFLESPYKYSHKQSMRLGFVILP